jgi:hypothetical protein
MPGRRLLALLCLALAFPPACGSSGGGGSSMTETQLSSGSIGPAGGTVAVTNPLSPAFGTKVVIPAGALPAPTNITISQVTSGGPYNSEVLTFDFGPSGTVFAVPVTVTVKYLQSYVDAHGVADETILRIQETSSGQNQVLSTSAQDTVNNTISATTSHFSLFAALLWTNATLNGSYFFQTWSYDHTGVQGVGPATGTELPCPKGYFTDWGTLTFDGNGGFTLPTGNEKYDQTVSGPFVGPSGTYQVDPNSGALTFPTGIPETTGNVLAGGKILLLRISVASDDVQFGVAVRAGTGFTNASLAGDYSFCTFAYDHLPAQPLAPFGGLPLPAAWPQGTFTNWGTMHFDGVTNVTVPAAYQKYDRVLSGPAAGTPGTYTVANDGSFTFAGGLAGTIGATSAGGDLIIFRQTGGSAPIQIGMAVRKGGSFTNADMAGSFSFQTLSFDHTVGQGATPAPGFPMPRPKGFLCDYATITFDGGTGAVVSGNEKIDQTITSFKNVTGTYSVAADGTLTLSGFGGAPGALGYVLLGSQVLLWVDNTASGIDQIAMAIRK